MPLAKPAPDKSQHGSTGAIITSVTTTHDSWLLLPSPCCPPVPPTWQCGVSQLVLLPSDPTWTHGATGAPTLTAGWRILNSTWRNSIAFAVRTGWPDLPARPTGSRHQSRPPPTDTPMNTPLEEQCCSNCRYLYPKTGRCHRHAPRPSHKEDRDAWWPGVACDDWCGEWIER